ncbi:hypothetical protein L0P88_19200 [Muricauda sp. SCSIO 64092]|uniref:hypothetical protein n=1 Tax=Allomuricauda sp. SCSIO 64092 TaxID=2908842 RepID=UPI001FF3945A|nr:hypothetical protein [Muricauda sp. SCSIO 64092]UOY06040.1 hypothetical protein L0P88_19200 [Muricauda sp. SCSIO 64092]
MKKTFTLLGLLIGSLYVGYAQEDSSNQEYPFNDIENYLYSPNQERKKSKEYFTEVKSLADSGNPEALYYLGMLQKDGIGTKQNFKKSIKSFKKSYELGNLEAAYSVGYYYLKGFGDVPQDYTKAYRWFKKSESSMGKHWMAKMQFLGLGRESNKTKAIKMLQSNDIHNSKVLLEQYKNEQPPRAISHKFSEFINGSSIENLHGLSNLHVVPDTQILEGTWEGEYFELDWSKKRALRALPIQLSFKRGGGVNESLHTEITIADSLATDTGTYSSGSLSFAKLTVPIKKQFTDYSNFTHLMTDIRALELRLCPYNGENLLIGRLNAFHPVWKERANPILLVLKKKINISEDAHTAFNEQASDFIRVYPNPVPEYCLINFELPHEANVKVEITNYYNTAPYHNVLFDGYREKGNHTLEIHKLPSQQGTYTLSISYNGKRENKLIIKE